MPSPHEDELLNLIAKEARRDRATLNRDATLKTLDIDSIDIVSVVFAIEDSYGITVGETEVTMNQTLGQVLDLAEAKIAQRQSAPAP